MPFLKKIGKNRDSKLRSVQAGITRAVVPQLLAVQELTVTKMLDREKVMDFAMDTLYLLGSVNALINQVRQDALKLGLSKKFQPLCKVPKEEDTCQYLLGAKLME